MLRADLQQVRRALPRQERAKPIETSPQAQGGRKAHVRGSTREAIVLVGHLRIGHASLTTVAQEISQASPANSQISISSPQIATQALLPSPPTPSLQAANSQTSISSLQATIRGTLQTTHARVQAAFGRIL